MYMIRLFESKTAFAAMCFLFAMAVLVSSFVGGSLAGFASNSVLVQPALKVADDGPLEGNHEDSASSKTAGAYGRKLQSAIFGRRRMRACASRRVGLLCHS
jgi:hypothetical protein